MTNLDMLGMIGLGLAIVLQWPFVILFATGPWWRDFVGQAIMAKSAVIAVVLTSTMIHAVVPTYRGEQAVRITLMWLITITIGYQLYALLRQRRQTRHFRDDLQPPVEHPTSPHGGS